MSYWANNIKTGNIIITTSGGTATSSENLTVTPTITGFSPISGKVWNRGDDHHNQLYRGEERLVTLLGFVELNH